MVSPAALVALRPWQWSKNLLVFAPLVFGRRYHDPQALAAALAAFVAFCLLASAGYLWNDVRDRKADRRHPSKRLRPVASGRLTVRAALTLAVVCGGLGMALAVRVGWPDRPRFLGLAALYAVVTTTYSAVLKRFAYLDVSTLAAGFLIRVFAGGAVIGVEVSVWLMACTFFGALYVGLGKRLGELALSADHGVTRASLDRYRDHHVRRAASIAQWLVVLCYSAYTVSPRTAAVFGSRALAWTIPFVIVGVWRFGERARRAAGVDDPARLFFSDPVLRLTSLLWGLAVALVLWHVEPHGSP